MISMTESNDSRRWISFQSRETLDSIRLLKMKKSNTFLILGDIVALAIVTVIGFATHGETGLSFVPRMTTTFFPLVIAWFLVSPWLGLFDSQVVSNPKLLWRPALAMMLAAPIATILRAAKLNAAALPLFTLILGTTSALGILIWRAIFAWLPRKQNEPGMRT